MPCNFLENCQGGCAEVSTVFINPDIYIYIYKDEFPGVGLVQKHFIATQSFMPLKRQSSGNCQEERIHGVL